MAEELNGNAGLVADVVIVGFGGAGAVAALRTVELGGNVIIVEKQAKDEHTPSTRLCGAIIFGVTDVEAGARYMDACAGGMIPYEVTHAWAEKACSMVEWLDAQGLDLRLQDVGGAENPQFEGSEAITVYAQARLKDGTELELIRGDSGLQSTKMMAAGASGGDGPVKTKDGEEATVFHRAGGPEYFRALREAVEARSDRIRVFYESPAESLVQEDGRVIGARCVGPDGEFTVRGTGGVVLSCGGYEYDEQMCINYLKASPIYFYGNPGNTGDGVRMAQSVGADLWHMNQMVGRAMGHFEMEDGRPLTINPLIGGAGYVITDKHGKRFANEYPQSQLKHSFYYNLLQYDPDAHDYPRIPCFWFFDHKRIGWAVTTRGIGLLGSGYYEWSADNRKEVENGWIKTADTIGELAQIMGISDPSAAVAEVEAYNEACRSGAADPFGRPESTMLPLEPPFYGMVLYPGGPNTSGGPRRNERAEIVDPYGEPIPGLYGAGELGEAVGLLYPADGANLSESVAFGRIAAETAMAAVAASARA
jgi:succinate dehydrogenase/fumarate reductase flavoprotein subunit